MNSVVRCLYLMYFKIADYCPYKKRGFYKCMLYKFMYQLREK